MRLKRVNTGVASHDASDIRDPDYAVTIEAQIPSNRLHLRRRLLEALTCGHIWPAFQPIVDIQGGTIMGFEILARWSDPIHGEIAPSTFIPILEKHGLIDLLSKSLIRTACEQAATWGRELFLAFNISPAQLLTDELPKWFRGIAVETGYPLRKLQIEVTESFLFADEEKAFRTIKKLDDLGVSISIDDFGTGYSSLARLESFPFRKLKIDARFVKGIDLDQGKRRIAAAIIGLGQSLGMTIVAEGIESEAEEKILSRLGCTLGQGWLYGRGVSATEAAGLHAKFNRTLRAETPLDASPFQQLHQLETLYEQIPVGLCFLDMQFRHVRVNDAFAAMHGATPGKLHGKFIDELMGGKTLARVKEVLSRSLTDPLPPQDYYLNGRDLRIYTQRVADVGGDVIGFSVVSVDVTDQKKLIQQLSLSELHFREMAHHGLIVAWGADKTGAVDYMSPSVEDLPEEPLEPRISRWYAKMHPADRPRIRQEWLAHITLGQPFRTQFRMRWKDGSYRWNESRAIPQFDDGGHLIRWCGTISDLAEVSSVNPPHARPRRPHTDILRNNSAAGRDLSALIFDGLSANGAALAIFGPDDRLVFSTPAFREIFDVRHTANTFGDIMRHCYHNRCGVIIDTSDIDQWLADANLKRRSQNERTFEVDAMDGRWFWAKETAFNDGWLSLSLADFTVFKKNERDLRAARDAAMQLAETDPLTLLPNRGAIMAYLAERIAAVRPEKPLTVAILDIDHFKLINDQFGHDAGDRVLKIFAADTKRVFLKSNRIGRVGGEEFLVVLPETDCPTAVDLLMQFRRQLRRLSASRENEFKITFSAGVAELQPFQALQDLYKSADQALYNAKRNGRDRIETV